jgi:chitinase
MSVYFNRNLDMINLMTYDIHGSWESHTGHHSPLYKHSSDTDNYHSIVSV